MTLRSLDRRDRRQATLMFCMNSLELSLVSCFVSVIALGTDTTFWFMLHSGLARWGY